VASTHPYRFKVHPDTTQHLGSIGPREVRELTYRLENVGDRPLRFRLEGQSESFKLVGGELDTPLPPQTSRALTFRLDPTGSVGYQRRHAKLVPDAPDQPTFLFRVDMTVRPDLTVDASTKSFGRVAPHERPELTFTFRRETEEPLVLTFTETPPKHVETELLPVSRGQVELRVVLHPERLDPGVHLGLETLRLQSNAPLQPSFTLYVDWKLGLPVRPEPSRIVFLREVPKPMTLRLVAEDGKPFRIRKARIEGNGFALEPLPKPGPVQRLTIHRAGRGPAEALLVLEGDSFGELKVPLAHRPPEKAPSGGNTLPVGDRP